MTEKEEVTAATDETAEKKEPEPDPLSLVMVADVVQEIVADLKRPKADGDVVAQALERHWVHTMADFHACVEGKVELPELPGLFRVKLAERLGALKKLHAKDDIGPKLDEISADTPEDREQKKVVEELAHAYEAGEKHKVITKIFINKLENLSTAEWTITFDIGVQCWYIDEDHVGHEEGEPDPDVFKPDFEFVGATEMETVICPDAGGSFYIRDSYRRWGIVSWYQRYRGTVKQELHLHSFPFDEQEIKIRFGMSLYAAEDILLVNRTDPKLIASFDGLVKNLHEWDLVTPSRVEEVLVFNEEDQRDISYLEYSVGVRRLGSYYFQNVFVLVYFLNILMWWTFLIDPNTLNDRLQICITCFLALVAFNFVVAEALPRISHSTYLTHFFALNYGFITLCAMESGISFLIDKYLGPPDNFITAKIVDWSFMGVYAVVQTIAMVIFFLFSRGHLKPRNSRIGSAAAATTSKAASATAETGTKEGKDDDSAEVPEDSGGAKELSALGATGKMDPVTDADGDEK